jgi:PIN domain nuclease of toxin-antitoxin system
MRALLDTNAFIWWVTNDPKLSARAAQTISSRANELLISTISVWEIAIKEALGRIVVRGDLQSLLAAQISENTATILPFALDHALRVANLPSHHKDPFDRALIAQAVVENVPIITSDRIISRYPVQVIW